MNNKLATKVSKNMTLRPFGSLLRSAKIVNYFVFCKSGEVDVSSYMLPEKKSGLSSRTGRSREH